MKLDDRFALKIRFLCSRLWLSVYLLVSDNTNKSRDEVIVRSELAVAVAQLTSVDKVR